MIKNSKNNLINSGENLAKNFGKNAGENNDETIIDNVINGNINSCKTAKINHKFSEPNLTESKKTQKELAKKKLSQALKENIQRRKNS
jgi:hypothetical protein